MKRNPLTALSRVLLLSALLGLAAIGCAGKKQPLESFEESQKAKMREKSVYVQADFDFWASIYEPTLEDLEALRTAWVNHGDAFPESEPILELERELRKTSQRVVLVALFMTEYDHADLNDRSKGWAVYPLPTKITELSETDLVLRRFMPVRNAWARYFLLRYAPGTLGGASQLVISNATSRVEIKRAGAQ